MFNELWDAKFAISEMIGSFILSFGVFMLIFASKSKALGLDSKLKVKGLMAVGIMALVVIGITTAVGLGAGNGHGLINPAIAMIVAVLEKEYLFLPSVIGFELLGGLLAGAFALFTIKMINSEIKANEVFVLSEQPVKKAIGMELFANVFWLLPVLGGVMLLGPDFGGFQIALFAGFAIVVAIFVAEEHGAANLNPQIWFGKVVMAIIVGDKGSVTGKKIATELTSVASVMAIGAALGGMGYGILSM
ncbi:MAG: hypothetical protein NC236_01170 [Mycoplasma sp.]|nr:hypothetical protein [Mycoplasma sp.]